MSAAPRPPITPLFVRPARFAQEPSHPLEERRPSVRGLARGLDGKSPAGATLDPELRQPSLSSLAAESWRGLALGTGPLPTAPAGGGGALDSHSIAW